jgi:hypothetical protein
MISRRGFFGHLGSATLLGGGFLASILAWPRLALGRLAGGNVVAGPNWSFVKSYHVFPIETKLDPDFMMVCRIRGRVEFRSWVVVRMTGEQIGREAARFVPSPMAGLRRESVRFSMSLDDGVVVDFETVDVEIRLHG